MSKKASESLDTHNLDIETLGPYEQIFDELQGDIYEFPDEHTLGIEIFCPHELPGYVDWTVFSDLFDIHISGKYIYHLWLRMKETFSNSFECLMLYYARFPSIDTVLATKKKNINNTLFVFISKH